MTNINVTGSQINIICNNFGFYFLFFDIVNFVSQGDSSLIKYLIIGINKFKSKVRYWKSQGLKSVRLDSKIYCSCP